MDFDRASHGSIQDSVGAATYQMSVIEDDQMSASIHKKGKKKKKKKKSERGDGQPSPQKGANGEVLEDIGDDELIQAYDNLSASNFDSGSAYSGPRQTKGAPGFDRHDSVGSASVGKVRQINYNEQLSAEKGGSSSYIIDDDQTPDMQKHGSFENNNFTNMTNIDRYSNDISMLKLNDPNHQDLQVKKGKKPKGKGRNQASKQAKSQPMENNYAKENFIDDYEEDLEMRQYDTPDMMIQKHDGYTDQAKQIAHDIMDMELGGGLKQRRAFTKEDFRQMITRTYMEYYGKFQDQFSVEEYMMCVEDEELTKRFGAFLEQSEDNMLTRENMPTFDLGDIPTTHSFMRSESQQTYYIPHNRNPELIYVRYSWLTLKPKFECRNPRARFDSSALPHKEVTYKDFTNTINLATMLMKNYRGKIQKYDMIGWTIILLGFFIIILMGIGTSDSDSGNWGNMVLYILLYFIMVPIVYKISKCFQCKYLRQAHFVLAVVCRAENNRYYLRRGVEVRPGYLARWIEFAVIDTEDVANKNLV